MDNPQSDDDIPLLSEVLDLDEDVLPLQMTPTHCKCIYTDLL